MKENHLSQINLLKLSEWLKVLAEPKRLFIINQLMNGVQCNCELGEKLKMSPNLISHHLGVLRQAGLVDVERDLVDSRWVYYSINQRTLDELNSAFKVFFDPDRIKSRRPTCGPKYLADDLETGLKSQLNQPGSNNIIQE